MRRLAALALGLLLVSCGQGHQISASTSVPTSTVPASAVPASTAPATTALAPTTTAIIGVDEPTSAVYLVMNGALHTVGRALGATDPMALMEALLAGPAAVEVGAGITSALPAGATVLGVTLDGPTARVNLSSNVAEGSPSELALRAAQVMYTLTALPGITSVEFAFDGVVNYGFGRPELNVHPLGRAQFTDGVLPPILLESPVPYARVSGGPLVLAGVASTFEATVNYKVLDPQGVLLAKGVTMATCGSGCWGTFRQTVELPAGAVGPFTVQVFDYSEKDGSMVDLQQIVVT